MNYSNEEKSEIRRQDMLFFMEHISYRYKKGKDLHHDWYHGAICFLLSREKHREADQLLYEEEQAEWQALIGGKI